MDMGKEILNRHCEDLMTDKAKQPPTVARARFAYPIHVDPGIIARPIHP